MCRTKVLVKHRFYLIFPSLSNEKKEDGEHIFALSSLNFEMCKWLGEFDIVWARVETQLKGQGWFCYILLCTRILSWWLYASLWSDTRWYFVGE